jgi:hypothetical protein
MKLISFCLLASTMIVACRSASNMSTTETKLAIENIRETLNNYFADIRKSGTIAEFKYLDDSPDFFWVAPGYSSPLSYDSVAHILKNMATRYKIIDNVFDSLRIFPLTRELATYTGRIQSTMTDSSGTTESYTLLETGLMVRRPDGWKLQSGQTSILIKYFTKFLR